MADGGSHTAHLAVLAFPDDEFNPTIGNALPYPDRWVARAHIGLRVEQAHLGGQCFAIFQHYAIAQLLQCSIAGNPFQLEVQWPTAAVAQCSGSAVTNTIVDGTDFTVSGTTTAGTNAQATLACPAPPTPPVASVSCTPDTLVDAAGQSASCAITLNVSQSADLTVNLQPPANNPRYQSSCQNTIVIPAGSTSATCSITATANTEPGDGDVTATLSISDATAYTVGVRSDSVVIKNDDQVLPPSTPAPVPSLSEWTLFGLSISLAVFGLLRIRRRAN